MTLILEVNDRTRPASVFIADCLVSTGDTNLVSAAFTPLHWGTRSGSKTTGRFLTSKALTAKDRMIMSSGEFSGIERVTEDFMRDKDGGLLAFQRFLDFVYSEHPPTESFIYYREVGDSVVGNDFRCVRNDHGDFLYAYGGSGTKFLEPLLSQSSPNKGADVFAISFDILGHLIRNELERNEFGRLGFGGCYEVFYQSFEGPKRIPYSVLEYRAESYFDLDTQDYVVKDVRPNRLINAVPVFKGTTFVISDLAKGGALSFIPVQEFNTPQKSIEQLQAETESAIGENWTPAATIVLLKHQKINYWLAGPEVVKFGKTGNSFTVEVNGPEIKELMEARHWGL